jgi:hypothetical protein
MAVPFSVKVKFFAQLRKETALTLRPGGQPGKFLLLVSSKYLVASMVTARSNLKGFGLIHAPRAKEVCTMALQSVLILRESAVHRDFLRARTVSRTVFTPSNLPLAFPQPKTS